MCVIVTKWFLGGEKMHCLLTLHVIVNKSHCISLSYNFIIILHTCSILHVSTKNPVYKLIHVSI